MMPADPSTQGDYDVIVMGGALSGAATATLLLRQNPGIRILILEKSLKLTRRVGEATVEVSAYFIGHVLGMTQYLNENHLAKQGLRFWHTNDEVESFDQCSEIGQRYQVKLPAYQLDRSTFDEEVLRRAVAAGATLLRPVTISSVELEDGGMQTVTYRSEGETMTATARWVVDASGRAAIISRRNGWLTPNTEHPTAAVWSRWKGVKDWDGYELENKFPEWASSVHCIRGTATNHINGDGWWSWWIPLKGGDMSIGIVYDQRLVDFPQDGSSVGERLKTFLMKHTVGKELLADATFDEEDVHWRKNLAYYSSRFAGDGFVLVGDAAAFMDPFYSPGMDWISYTTSCATNLITEQRNGVCMKKRVAEYNHTFTVSHKSWFSALYKDKYDYMGEHDLLGLAYRFDLGLYYWGVAIHPFKMGAKALLTPPFAPPGGGFVHGLMSTYNRRLAQIARHRRRNGMLGKTNKNKRDLIGGFKIDEKDAIKIFPILWRWLKLEVKEGWKSWGETPEQLAAARRFDPNSKRGKDKEMPEKMVMSPVAMASTSTEAKAKEPAMAEAAVG